MDKKIILIIVILLAITGIGFLIQFKYNSEGVTGRLLNIKERGELVVGTHAKYPPMESRTENGEFIGLDMDLARIIADDLRVRLVLVDIPWENLFNEVQSGTIDMALAAITITEERTKSMSFSDPYFNAGQVIVALKERSDLFKKPAQLKDRKVGAQTNTTSEAEARKYSENVIPLDNNILGSEKLLSGEIEALIMDYPTAVSLTAKDPRFAITSEIFTQEFYGIATQKDETSLLTALNDSIRNLKRSGEMKQLESFWLSQ